VTPQRRRRIPIIPFQHSEIPALQPVSRGGLKPLKWAGNQVRTLPAEQLSRERIVILRVGDRRCRSGRPTQVSGLSGQPGCRD
jgi:hypothetical protein